MTGQHLDLDQLADLLADGYDAAGQPDPSEPSGTADSAALEHARACPACTGELQSLQHGQELVSATLAGLADPPLPPGLAARLEDALARERSSPTAADPATYARPSRRSSPDPEQTAPVSSPGTVLPLRHRRPAWQPWAAGAAAAAVLGVGGVLLTRAGGVQSGTSSSAVDSTAGGAAAGPAVPTSSTGTDYRSPAALAVALPVLLRGATTAPRPAAAVTGSPRQDPSPAASPTDTSPQLLSGTQLDRLRDPRALADCLGALQDPAGPVRPLALDYARYAGAPALIVVLPSTRAGKVDVYAVGAACSATDARVLTFSRLTAP